GATNDVFTGPALHEVYRLSGGVPRVINIICDRALLGAYSMDRHRVTSNLVRSAAAEVFGRRFTPYWMPWAATGATAVVLLLAAVALLEFQPWKSTSAHAMADPPGGHAGPASRDGGTQVAASLAPKASSQPKLAVAGVAAASLGCEDALGARLAATCVPPSRDAGPAWPPGGSAIACAEVDFHGWNSRSATAARSRTTAVAPVAAHGIQ